MGGLCTWTVLADCRQKHGPRYRRPEVDILKLYRKFAESLDGALSTNPNRNRNPDILIFLPKKHIVHRNIDRQK